jgi:integrase
MAGRRAGGEGSVYRYRDGWAAQVRIGQGRGARRKTVYGRTQGDVIEKLRTMQRQIDAGVVLRAGRSITVGAYLESWVRDVLPGSVRASTEASYETLVRMHLVPGLGSIALDKLTPTHVRAFLRAKASEVSVRTKRPLSPRTLQYLHAVLRLALEQARRDELVTRNVAMLVAAPRVSREEIRPLTVVEARALFAAAVTDRLRPLWLVLVSLGLRRGEALALRWEDIDLDTGVVQIRRSLQRVRGKLLTVEPKTERSRRALPLPAVLVDVLREHRRAQVAERLAAPAWVDPEMVFTTHVGTPLEPRNVLRSFHALCRRAGVREVRIHDLRHAAASFLLLQGVDMRVVMGTLGHSRQATTSDLYTHLLEPVQRDAADRMDALLRDVGGA